MTSCKVLGLGSPILDLLVMTDDSFLAANVEGEKGGMSMLDASVQQKLIAMFPADRVKKAIGGSAFNTISALTTLGMSTAFLGKTGTDANGVFYRDTFAKQGGDVSRFRTTQDAPTATCLSMVTQDSERTMRTHLGASSLLTADEVTAADFEGITHLHVEGYMLFLPGVVEKAMRLAQEQGASVSFDLASFEVVRIFRNDIARLLKEYTDIVFANEDEAKEFCGTASFAPQTAAAELRKLCRTAVVKLGRKGSYLADEKETALIAPRLVKAIDTTGAGDLWQAGFLYGYLSGFGLRKAGEMGAVMGAEIVQVLGAEIPAARWNVIKSQFKQIEEQ